ncbi:Expansin-like B1 [Bienertia sinuspersici]
MNNVQVVHVAAVSRRLYRNGARCGACYQIKCTEEECNEDGVRVVVTDQGESRDDSDFILSVQAFAKMAKPGMEHNLKAYGHEVNLQWRACRRAYGAVWDISNPPRGRGGLTMRFFATASVTAQAKWVVVPNVIPLTWKAGVVYDTSIQLS